MVGGETGAGIVVERGISDVLLVGLFVMRLSGGEVGEEGLVCELSTGGGSCGVGGVCCGMVGVV